jgi:hypothetical protein
VSFQSRAEGLVREARRASRAKLCDRPGLFRSLSIASNPHLLRCSSDFRGVGNVASVTHPSKSIPPVCVAVLLLFGPPLGVLGVGTDEIETLTDVGCARAVCAQYRKPNGVRLRFQVSMNKVEPAVSNRSISLLTKDCSRAALADETIPGRPEVTRVCKPLSFARNGEAGARAASGPHRALVWPSCISERETPEAAPREEMALGVSGKLSGPNIDN